MPIMQFDELTPGMILDQDILNAAQTVVLGEGTKLTKEHIKSLSKLDVDFIFIKDDKNDQPVSDVIQRKNTERLSAFDKSIFQMRIIEQQIKSGEKLSAVEIFDCVKELVKAFYGYDDVLEVLEKIQGDNQYELAHGPSVAIISILLGKWIKLDHQKLYYLAMGAYLSNIGLFKIPVELIDVSRKINDAERKHIEKHIEYAIEVLNKSDNFPREVIDIISQYHERCDGSGYPNKIYGDQISKMAKIVAIADVFHACLSKRPYRELPYSVFEATEIIWELSYSKLDSEVSERLVKYLTAFWTGRKVKLSNGMIGEIIMINRYDYFRPLIRVGEEFIDLSVDHTYKIVGEAM